MLTNQEIAARLLVIERHLDELSSQVRILFQDVLDTEPSDV